MSKIIPFETKLPPDRIIAVTEWFKCPSPWALMHCFKPAFLWQDPEGKEIWAGLGWLYSTDSLDMCRAALANVECYPDEDVPLRCFAAVAFDSQSPLKQEWKGFAPTWFVLPEALIRWRDGEVELLVLDAVDDDEEMETVMELLLEEAKDLKRGWRRREKPQTAIYHLERDFTEDKWAKAVLEIQQSIAGNQVQKAVLAQSLLIKSSLSFNHERIMRDLANEAPNSYVFYHGLNESTAFLGASPERLFRLKGNHLQVDSLAGTRPRGQTPEDEQRFATELIESKKERREQHLVTDHLAQCMTELCDNIRVDSAPAIRRFGAVQHLLSSMEGTLRPKVSLDTILKTLHPTPATCGSPINTARELIRKLEPTPRGLYAGAVGWVSLEEAEFAVAIRSALIRNNEARVYAGAGIVADSVPEEEYQECSLKQSLMTDILTRSAREHS
jgi:isochorismate synthase